MISDVKTNIYDKIENILLQGVSGIF